MDIHYGGIYQHSNDYVGKIILNRSFGSQKLTSAFILNNKALSGPSVYGNRSPVVEIRSDGWFKRYSHI